jgi:hypothetical protein
LNIETGKKLKLFRRRKKEEKSKPENPPLEVSISAIISSESNKAVNKIEFNQCRNILDSWEKAEIFSICHNTDDFYATIVVKGVVENSEKIKNELHELTEREVLQYEYNKDFFLESLWSLSTKTLFATEEKSLLIAIDDSELTVKSSQQLNIRHSKAFSFGKFLMKDLRDVNFPVSVSYDNMFFTFEMDKNESKLLFESTLAIESADYQFYYLMNHEAKYTAKLVKAFIKEQKKYLETHLKRSVSIKHAGLVESVEDISKSSFSMGGVVHTPISAFNYTFIFPKKFLNLFPQYICNTIKGRTLQINKEYFRKDFDSFYKSGEEFLFSDYFSIIDNRDMNLICQNFFLSNSISGEKIKKLFFYKVTSNEKKRINKVPMIGGEQFLNHLPLRLKESYLNSKNYSRNFEELLDLNQLMLDKIYREMKEKKLLLSYKSRYILDKELGSKNKENKTRRLKKLISDKRYINYLDRLDDKKVQILLSNMKNVLIVDTFIYQADELIKLKPYFSQRRFKELKEDINFTQGKVKTNQIDINRICDSIEKFNGTIRDFVKKDQENQT